MVHVKITLSRMCSVCLSFSNSYFVGFYTPCVTVVCKVISASVHPFKHFAESCPFDLSSWVDHLQDLSGRKNSYGVGRGENTRET